MDFHFKRRQGNVYQLAFEPRGLCLSPSKKYSVLILWGKCVSWCVLNEGKLEYSIVAMLGFDYIVVSNLDCWDILQVLEADHVHLEDMLDLCYENESTDS